MQKKLRIIVITVLLIIISILSYQLYVSHTLLKLQQDRDFSLIETHFKELSDRSNQVLTEWDNEHSEASTLLYNQFLLTEGMLWGRPATKFYKVNLISNHTVSFSGLSQFISIYRGTIEEDLNQVSSNERSAQLRERVQMVAEDMSFLSKKLNSEKLNEFSSSSEFYDYWDSLLEQLQNKEAVIQ